MLKVISVCHDKTHAAPLIYSLDKHGWDFEIIETPWKGFGTKIIETYNYLKAHPEVDEFVFVDAFDVVALGGPEEFKEKVYNMPTRAMDILFSAEKALWPPILNPFKKRYPPCENGNSYINSGLYYASSSMFITLMDRFPPSCETDDQYWANMLYLMGFAVNIDYNQNVFNSYSFIQDGEYTYNNGRVQVNGNEPIFIHGNGKSDMSKIYELI